MQNINIIINYITIVMYSIIYELGSNNIWSNMRLNWTWYDIWYDDFISTDIIWCVRGMFLLH
jgi:hypothetical protein